MTDQNTDALRCSQSLSLAIGEGLGDEAAAHIRRLVEENEAHLAAMRQALEALELELMHGPLIAECHAAISTLKARLGDD